MESYNFEIGTIECKIVIDGTFAYPHPAQVLFVNAPREQLTQALGQHNLNWDGNRPAMHITLRLPFRIILKEWIALVFVLSKL